MRFDKFLSMPCCNICIIFIRACTLFAEKYRGRMYFNVAGSTADSLPALLLIHGDSYSWGAGNSFDGTALAAHGRLIVVSINFRLGVLGKLGNTYSMKRTAVSPERRTRLATVRDYFTRLRSRNHLRERERASFKEHHCPSKKKRNAKTFSLIRKNNSLICKNLFPRQTVVIILE